MTASAALVEALVTVMLAVPIVDGLMPALSVKVTATLSVALAGGGDGNSRDGDGRRVAVGVGGVDARIGGKHDAQARGFSTAVWTARRVRSPVRLGMGRGANADRRPGNLSRVGLFMVLGGWIDRQCEAIIQLTSLALTIPQIASGVLRKVR